MYKLRCLSPTESNGMKSNTQEITLFGWKATASSISFLIKAPTPSIGPLPCPDSVKTQLTWMLFSKVNCLVKKALYLFQYWLVGLSNITHKYFSCSKLSDVRTFSEDTQTARALCDLASDIVPWKETPLGWYATISLTVTWILW